MLLKLNFRRLLGLSVMTLAVFLFLANVVSAAWQGPSAAPPLSNVAPPLNASTDFDGDIKGTYNNLRIQIENCSSTDRFLTWDGLKVACSNVGEAVNTINEYYETTNNNPLAGNLLQVLTNGSDAKGYVGGIVIGSSSPTWLNLGGALTAGWFHSTQPGNNTLAGSLNIGPSKDAGLSLQIEKVDTTANLAGKYWASGWIASGPPPMYAGKEIFNILAKVGTVGSASWTDSISGKISFVGVSNNHIPLTDIVFSSSRRVNEAPIEQLRITSAGRVGLGTSTPNSAFHLYNAFANSEIDIQSISGFNKHWGIYQDHGTEELRFWNSESENLLSLKKSGVVSVDGSLELFSQAPANTAYKLYNATGTLYWNGSRIGMGAYVGKSQATRTGSAGSYIGANALCNSTYAGSRVCFNFEMINSIASNVTALKNETGVAWVQTGAAGNSYGAANDCMALQSSGGTDYGTVWAFDIGDWGSGFITTCNYPYSFACCK